MNSLKKITKSCIATKYKKSLFIVLEEFSYTLLIAMVINARLVKRNRSLTLSTKRKRPGVNPGPIF